MLKQLSGELVGEQVIKKSRFIVLARFCPDRAALAELRKDAEQGWPNARHYCWAWTSAGTVPADMAMSDDGEPKGTAGMPMLKVLELGGWRQTGAVVIRYFGGIKLGTGGLARAYAGTLQQMLEQAQTIPWVPRNKFYLTADFSVQASVQHMLQKLSIIINETSYSGRVIYQLSMSQEERIAFEGELKGLPWQSFVLKEQ